LDSTRTIWVTHDDLMPSVKPEHRAQLFPTAVATQNTSRKASSRCQGERAEAARLAWMEARLANREGAGGGDREGAGVRARWKGPT